MSFLITGFGRSGTTFLQQIMNTSKNVTVEHEPRKNRDEKWYDKYGKDSIPPEAAKSFKRNNYGEVNSRLRFFAHIFPVDKLGIIIRDPKDIFKSTMNRDKDPHKMAHDIHWAYSHFMSIPNWHYIDFKLMTTNKEYIKNVCNTFGVSDAVIPDKLTRVNTNKDELYETYDDLPKKIKNIFEAYKWKKIYKKLNINR